MGWQFGIGSLFAAAGFLGAFYAYYRNAPLSLSAPLAFFSLTGLLQAYSHTIANQCILPENQVAALLAYLHWCFQPFFINAVALHFIDKRAAVKIDLIVYTLCFIAMTMMLVQVYPFVWAGQCGVGNVLCGEQICTIRDGWFIGWMLPITQVQDTIPWYFLAAVVAPLVYGSWRFLLLYIGSCLLPAFLMTQNMNEWPGVSALLTVLLLLGINYFGAIRKRMVMKCQYIMGIS